MGQCKNQSIGESLKESLGWSGKNSFIQWLVASECSKKKIVIFFFKSLPNIPRRTGTELKKRTLENQSWAADALQFERDSWPFWVILWDSWTAEDKNTSSWNKRLLAASASTFFTILELFLRVAKRVSLWGTTFHVISSRYCHQATLHAFGNWRAKSGRVSQVDQSIIVHLINLANLEWHDH